jgi:uncharacterized membrane protein YkoI
VDRIGAPESQFVPEVNVRTAASLLIIALVVSGCSSDAPTKVQADQPRITEPRVATIVGAIAAQAVALEEDRPGLLQQTRVTDANARVIALRQVPGGRIVEAELEEEGGQLVYEYEIRVADGRGLVEVAIDARTGAVLSEERDDSAADDKGRPESEDDDETR